MATRAEHSGHVGYNVQSVVDAETHLIVTHEVTNQGHDRDLLTKMATQAKAVLQHEDMHILAGKGYFSALEILACHKAGITATVPRSDTSGARSKGHFVKADFAYEHDADVYRCPAGQALTHHTTTEQQGLQMRRYWTNACKDCGLKGRCTTGHEKARLQMGTRAPGRSLECPPPQSGSSDERSPLDSRASVWHDQGLDWILPFSDTAAWGRGHGNGAERAGLQHPAYDRSGRDQRADCRDPGLDRADIGFYRYLGCSSGLL